MALGDTIGQAVIRVIPDTQGFGAAVQRSVGRSLDQVGRRLQSTGQSLTRSLTLPIVGVGAAIANLGTQFETNLSFVTGLVGDSQRQVDAWGKQLIELGPELGKSPIELADALYFVRSSGIDASRSMEVVRASAKAASAGLGDTGVIADTVTSVLNAYADVNYSASDATDALVAAVKEGKAEADEIAPVLGRLIPIAAAMGISFEDVAATIAVFTRTGLDAAEASVSLNSIMSTLLKPSKQAQEMLETVGLEFSDLRDMAAKPGGLIDVMRLLDRRFRDNDEGLARIFPNVRAFRGVMNALAQDAGSVDEVFQAVQNSTGDTNRAFEIASQTAKFKFNAAISAAQGTLITLFETLKPFITEGLEKFTAAAENATDAWNNLTPGMQRFAFITAGAVAAIGPFLAIVGTMARAIAGVGLLLTPTGLVIGGLALLATTLGGVFATSDKFREKFSSIVDSIRMSIERGDWASVGRTIRHGFDVAVDSIKTAGGAFIGSILAKIFGGGGGPGGEGGAGIVGSIKMHIEREDWASVARTVEFGIGQMLGNLTFAELGTKVSDALKGLFGSINWREFGTTLANALIGAIQGMIAVAGRVAAAIAEFLKALDWVGIGKAVVPAVIGLVLGIAAAITDPTVWYDALIAGGRWKTTLTVLIGVLFAPSRWIKGISTALRKIPFVGRILASIVEGISGIGSKISAVAGRLWESFATGFRSAIGRGGPGIISRVVGFFRDLPTHLRVIGSEFVDAVASWLVRAGNWIGRHGPAQIVNAFRTVRNGVINFFKTAGSWIVNAGKNLIGGLWKGIQDRWLGVRIWFNAIGGLVTRTVGSLVRTLAQRGRELLSGLWQGIQDRWIGVRIWWNALGGLVSRTIGSLLRSIVSRGRELISGFWSGISTRFVTVRQWFSALPRQIFLLLSGAGRALLARGRELISGLRSGVTSGMSGIRDFLKRTVWDPIVRGVKSLFGINSPSTVFAGFGKDMIRGLVQGLIAGNPAQFIKKIFGGMSGAAIQALQYLFNKGLIGIDALMGLPMKVLSKLTGLFGGGQMSQAFGTGRLVMLGHWLQSLGARVGEHPAFGGVSPVHTSGSLHYIGDAIDVNYGPGGQSAVEMAFFDRIVGQIRSGLFGSFREILWRVAGHFNHLHVGGSFAKGIDFVPDDMLALVHKGERIVPAELNRQLENLRRGGNAGGRQSTTLNLHFTGDGSKRADFLIDELRSAIARRGRDVQSVLGSR